MGGGGHPRRVTAKWGGQRQRRLKGGKRSVLLAGMAHNNTTGGTRESIKTSGREALVVIKRVQKKKRAKRAQVWSDGNKALAKGKIFRWEVPRVNTT